MRRFILALVCALAGAGSLSAAALHLSWQDNSDNEEGFAIDRAVGSGDTLTWEEVARVGADVIAYSDTGLASDTVYSYRVRAWNRAGYSGYTNTASGRTLPTPPANPGLLTVPDEPPVVVIRSDVRIEGNLLVAGTIQAEPPAPPSEPTQ